jgi:GTP-binding protein Era
VALHRRPNAGKSTLLNRIIGQKLAIVSDKPQTTRARVRGVKNYAAHGESPAGQIVVRGHAGVHKPTHRLNARMVNTALDAMRDVDVVALVVDASVKAGPGDRFMLDVLKELKTPTLLALNKVDLIKKTRLLPLLESYRQAHRSWSSCRVSAADGTNVDVLERLFLTYLPEGEPLVPAGVPHRPDRAVLRRRDRARARAAPDARRAAVSRPPSSWTSSTRAATTASPRSTARFSSERESQKPIVVGRGGAMIKAIGTRARAEMEREMERRMYLDLHVKVKAEWRDDERLLDDIAKQNRETE